MCSPCGADVGDNLAALVHEAEVDAVEDMQLPTAPFMCAKPQEKSHE